MADIRQLNPFEIKALISHLVNDFDSADKIEDCIDDIKLLDGQNDKKTITKLLYKELYNLKGENGTIICFLLERFVDKDELSKKMWELLRNELAPNNVKLVVVNFLRGLDTDWELNSGDELLDAEIIDADTRKLLNNALVNPEIQIDFLDFLSALSPNDKIVLIDSLAQDYSKDELANILIPVFLSQSESEVGITALNHLGESKSQLAFHALNSSLDFINKNIQPLVKKNLSKLKLSGIREDNSYEFYKNILSESEPYKSCITYPDGHGNQALIFTRKTKENRVRFVAIVIDDYHGIRDCFGFYDISQFECDKIIERFYHNEKELIITPQQLKSILNNAENISKTKANNWLIPYEYICWKNLLTDMQTINIEDEIKTNLKTSSISNEDLNIIFNMDFMNKWFLDSHYSDEFEELITQKTLDFDSLIEKYIDKVFYSEERQIWIDRLLIVAYLKLTQCDKESATLLYSLYNDRNLHNEFFRHILKKSIYEYYTSLKFNTGLNNGQYSLDELDQILKHIEDLWVCTK